ncbi:DUF1775 domain-containing protein [Microbacterium sp. bgisy189]|uniref:DUF1775 domain-containing protein n=1 Tax=Microbacterium sp. bgisy189 TaxID=3413798 RepID=UPI003EBFD38D
MTTTTRTRSRARLIAGSVAGLALAAAAPLAASAHVHVAPGDAPAGATTRLDFSFSHGCDGAATTAIIVDVPEIVDGLTPVLDGAWTISRELGDDGIPTRVVYTAATPVEDGVAASVAMDVIFPQSAADTGVPFPVTQQCGDAQTAWVEVAEDGQDADDLEAPAPVVAVGAVAEDTEGHGHDSGDAEATPETHQADTVTTTDDPVARWLAGGALVAALAALVVALLRRRA